MLWYIATSLAFALAGLLIYFYYHQQGQFEDSEDVKYQLFHEEQERSDKD